MPLVCLFNHFLEQKFVKLFSLVFGKRIKTSKGLSEINLPLKDKLNIHVNTVHSKRKPFKCAYCNQVFGRQDTAKRHEKQWCSNRPDKAGNTISGPEMDIVSGPEMNLVSEPKLNMGSEPKPVLVSEPDVVSGPEMDVISGLDMDMGSELEPDVISGPEMEVGSELEPFEQKPEVETNFSNPWNVPDLSLFLRYCCPECDYKCEEAHLFCEHALDFHRNSNVLLENLRGKNLRQM